MNMIPPIELIFIAIGLVFLVMALRDYFRSGKKMLPACKIRLRMAAVFIAVGIGLYILKTFFR